MNELIGLVKNIAPGIATLLGGPIAGGIVSLIGGHLLGNPNSSISDVVTAVKDPDVLLKLKELENQLAITKINADIKIEDDQFQNTQAQIKVNEEEAKSESFFKSGARPAMLWVGVIGMAYNYLIVPVCHSFGIPAVNLDINTLMPLVMSLLGISGMRTYEKLKGVK